MLNKHQNLKFLAKLCLTQKLLPTEYFKLFSNFPSSAAVFLCWVVYKRLRIFVM